MKSLARTRGKGKIKVMERRAMAEQNLGLLEIDDLDIKVNLIQALIPLGLKEVGHLLQQEVMHLAGEPNLHGKVNTRWGSQPGSIYLADQKVPVTVPRVRNKDAGVEVPLETYRKFQKSQDIDSGVFLKLLNGLSTHNYEDSAALAPEVFGLSASSVSKKFRQQAVRHLQNLMERQLNSYDFTAIFFDGKAYAQEELVVALGITLDGKKVILGIEQMSAESSLSMGQFIDKLIERGLRYDHGLLIVVDGSKGIIAAVEKKFANHALIQRCREHKIRNVLSYLPQAAQKAWRIKMRQAYAKDNYNEACTALEKLAKELDTTNPSAAASLREGMLDTLTLQRLGLNKILSPSFGATNCIESVFSQLGRYTDKVNRWRNGKQIQQWAAAGLTRIEPKLHRVVGCNSLPLLRERLRITLQLNQEGENKNETELTGAAA